MIGGYQSCRGSGGCISPSGPCWGFRAKALPQSPPEAPAFAGIENLKILLSGRLYWPCMHAMAMANRGF